jgi:spore maturation protein CgeB
MRLAELGTDIIVVPPSGKAVASPWWRHYENPIPDLSFHNMTSYFWSNLKQPYLMKLHHKSTMGDNSREKARISSLPATIKDIKDRYFSVSYKQHWVKYLEKIWKREKKIDAVFLFDDMLSYVTWLPRYVHRYHNVPLIAYNADLPTYLWDEGSWRFSPFHNVDLGEYDAFIVNSEGVADKFRKMGFPNVHVLHFGADPDLFSPVPVEKDIDVSFYGYGSNLREEAMLSMITKPSYMLKKTHFRTAGHFNLNLGCSKNVGRLTFASMRDFCCRSKINLNITRKPFAETYCSSTSRPFELAAMQSCIVSNPCRGMNKWFEPGKEILEVHDEREACEVYKWLLSDAEFRAILGKNARKKVCEKHTYRHRAAEFIEITEKICGRSR